MRKHLVTMVQNSIEYLPEFLTYHRDIFDYIHVIDHNSKFDLSSLRSDKFLFYRVYIKSYLQEEVTNIVQRHIVDNYSVDWLYTLDVDEFLPFKQNSCFENFLNSVSNKKVISFNWRNGVPFDFKKNDNYHGISESNDLIFYKELSPTLKCAVNVKRCGKNFYTPRSNHRVETFSNSIRSLWRRPTAIQSHSTGLGIYHVLSSSLDDFGAKIRRFKQLRRTFDGVKGHGGSLIYKYPDEVNESDWLKYTANYRVGDPSKIRKASRDDFAFGLDFEHLDKSLIRQMKKILLENRTSHLDTVSSSEENLLLMKKELGIRARLYSKLSLREGQKDGVKLIEVL